MAGLAGIIRAQHDGASAFDTLSAMSAALVHRGDRCLAPVVLGRAAFSGREHSKGVYAADLAHDGRRIAMVDGNIHNKRELLERTGLAAHSSAGLLVIELYKRHGPDFVRQLQGAYAIVIYDTETDEVFLCRDVFASRPLYFAQQNNRFWVASEIKAILADPAFSRAVNRALLPQHLTYGATFGPTTLFDGVYKCTPGYYSLGCPDGELSLRLFFKPEIPPKQNLPARQYEDELWSLVGQNLTAQLNDCPLDSVRTGLFVSGGVDSSLVAMEQHELGIKNKVAISCGYSGESAEIFDETEVAERTARQCGMEFENVVTDPGDDLLLSVRNIIRAMEEPTRFSIAIPIERGFRQLQGRFDCLLTGTIADTIFGCPEQRDAPMFRFRNDLPQSMRRMVHLALPLLRRMPKIKRLAQRYDRADVDTMRGYYSRHLKFNRDLRGLVDVFDADDCVPHLQQIYAEVDRLAPEDEMTLIGLIGFFDCWLELFELLGSYNSVDVVHPFASEALYELALRMPYQGKIARHHTKPYLRALAARKFSPELAYDKKQIFNSPLQVWLRDNDGIKVYVRGLNNEAARIHEFLDTAAIRAVLQDYERCLAAGRVDPQTGHLVFSLMGLEIWLEQFF